MNCPTTLIVKGWNSTCWLTQLLWWVLCPLSYSELRDPPLFCTSSYCDPGQVQKKWLNLMNRSLLLPQGSNSFDSYPRSRLSKYHLWFQGFSVPKLARPLHPLTMTQRIQTRVLEVCRILMRYASNMEFTERTPVTMNLTWSRRSCCIMYNPCCMRRRLADIISYLSILRWIR